MNYEARYFVVYVLVLTVLYRAYVFASTDCIVTRTGRICQPWNAVDLALFVLENSLILALAIFAFFSKK